MALEIAFADVVKLASTAVVRELTAPIQTTTISANINAYSTAVGPDSSSRNDKIAGFMKRFTLSKLRRVGSYG
jgi:hypothetical protein